MDRQRWSRVKSVFESASRLPPWMRQGWVWFNCGRDVELRRVVLRLLENAVLRDSFLELEPETTGPRLPLTPPSATALPDLELQERIGQGGMGVVYKARQLSLNRTVAVKMLPDLLAVSESRRKAFENESRIIAGLNHPNIVPVYWSGRTDSAAYYVMEHVEGKSLEALLFDCRDVLEPHALLEPANVARFVARIANALQATHAHGVAHRDVKPGNILVTRDGQPKLADFGLARSIDKHTLDSRIVGTPHYMSPEQARLQDVRIDHRTDIYSLGVVMYEMLTLRRPFEGRTLAEVLIAIRERDPVRVRKLKPAVPRDLETICHKAMRKHPDQRYASAAEFESDLLAFLDHRSPSAQPPTLVERAQAGIERHRTAAIVIAVTAVLVPVAQWLLSRAVELRSLRARVDALPVSAVIVPTGANRLDAISARLRQHRRTLEDVRAIAPQAASLSSERREHMEQAERAARADLVDMRRELLDLIGHNLLAGVASAAGTDEALLTVQSTLLADVYELEGSAQPDAQLAELLLPRITLTTDPPGATVFARRLDASTGVVVDTDWADLGTSDLVDLPVVPGYYRFIAVAPDGRYAEITQLVADSGLTSVFPELVLRPSDEVAADMLRIEAGDYATSVSDRLHRDWPGALTLHEKEPVGAFLVDRDEVTNAQFAAYCAATGLTPPLPPGGPDARWDARPVAFVDVYQAEAYAAWSGKRLLVKCEWRRAAEGDEGRRFPWGNDSAEIDAVQEHANVHNRPVLPPPPAGPVEPRTTEDDWPMYLLGTQPVGSFPAGATPEGVRDLLGNVSEWTATIFMNKVGRDVWRPESGTHVVLGLSFWEDPNVFDSDALIHSPAVSYDIGIRCGRTAPEEVPSVK